MYKLIWTKLVLLLAIFIQHANTYNDTDAIEEHYCNTGRNATKRYISEFGRNSSYHERQWNITRGREMVKDGDGEDCSSSVVNKTSKFKPSGPLCEICSQTKNLLYSSEVLFLRYGAFLYGILTFPDNQDQMLIDVVLCSYDPEIGIDRFYVTRGKESNSAYLLANVGSDRDKYKFALQDEYITWE